LQGLDGPRSRRGPTTVSFSSSLAPLSGSEPSRNRFFPKNSNGTATFALASGFKARAKAPDSGETSVFLTSQEPNQNAPLTRWLTGALPPSAVDRYRGTKARKASKRSRALTSANRFKSPKSAVQKSAAKRRQLQSIKASHSRRWASRRRGGSSRRAAAASHSAINAAGENSAMPPRTGIRPARRIQ
jgi:hypothetical protein